MRLALLPIERTNLTGCAQPPKFEGIKDRNPNIRVAQGEAEGKIVGEAKTLPWPIGLPRNRGGEGR